MINIYKKYAKFKDYELKIKDNDKIKKPFFDLFYKNSNLISDFITLAMQYSEIENYSDLDYLLKLSQSQKEIVMINMKLIDNTEINNEKQKEHNEWIY